MGTVKISREDILTLSTLSSWRFCLALGFDLTIIIGAITMSEHFFFNSFVYFISIILIGSRLHAFGILMHDCVHYRAFQTRRLNMIVGELLGWCVLVTAESYRNNHLTHHRYLNTNQDPDWVRKLPQDKFHFPKSKWGVFTAFLFQLSGLGILELFFQIRHLTAQTPVSKKTRFLRLMFYIVVGVLCVLTGTWGMLALYWLIPMLTTFAVFNYIRSVAEHHGNLGYDHSYTGTRTTIPTEWEGFLFLPHHVGYHLEHHLYPHVPFYRLKSLHKLLMQQTDYAQKAHLSRGVCVGLLKEWVGPPKGPSILDLEKGRSDG